MSITTTPYGFIPTQVAGLALWLDASDTTTITQSSGNITQWRDKSTSGLTATAANNPTLVAKIQNGFPGISLDGSTQYFNLGNNLNMGTNQIYIFVVSKFNSTADGAIIGKSLYGSAGARYSLLRSGALIPLIEASGGAVNNSGFNSDTSTSARLLNMVWDRSTINLYQNGSSVFSVGLSDSSNLTTGNSLLIGAYQNGSGGVPPAPGLYMNGYIHEILMYFTSTSSPLGNTSRQQIESYLAQKWGLTLGAGHPGLTSTVYRSTYLKNTTIKQNVARMTPFFTAFTPRQIPGLILWVDGTDPAGNGVIPANGATVSTWVDKSGLVNNATTYSGITTYSTSLKALFFSNSGFQTSIVTPTNRVGSGFFVVRATVNSGNVVFQGSGLGYGGRQFRNDNGTILKTIKENIVEMFLAGPTVLNTLMLVGYVDDGNNLTHCLNGTLYTTTTATTFTEGRTILLGKSFNGEHLIGYIHEVVLFNINVTTTQRQQIESYLAQKWGLTSSLAAGHSHLTQPAGARTALSLANSKITIRPIFLPTSIANIQMWMDGADPAGTGVIPSNGSVLSSWADKSGKSYNASGVNSPTVVTNAVNSKSVVSYNGSNYSFSTIAAGVFSTAMIIFFVYKVNGAVTYMTPMTRGVFTNGSPIDQYNNTRFLGGNSYNGYTSAYSHASATSTSLFTQIIQQSPSTTYNEYVNGSTTSSLSVTGFSASDTASYVYIGTRDNKGTTFNGYMCELIVYNQMIGLTAQQKIEGYLAWKWGIQASLPAGHPYKSARP